MAGVVADGGEAEEGGIERRRDIYAISVIVTCSVPLGRLGIASSLHMQSTVGRTSGIHTDLAALSVARQLVHAPGTRTSSPAQLDSSTGDLHGFILAEMHMSVYYNMNPHAGSSLDYLIRLPVR